MNEKRLSKTDSVQFKPLSEGLGFHPFSEGLPYASGAGATAAGKPKFINQKNVFVQPRPKLAEARVPTRATARKSLVIEHFLMRRFGAFCLDATVSALITGVILLFAAWGTSLGMELFKNSLVLLVSGILWMVMHWFLVLSQELITKTSLGKRVVGLKLQGTLTGIFARGFFLGPSVLCLGLGFAWCLLDERRRAWHDLAADVEWVEAS